MWDPNYIGWDKFGDLLGIQSELFGGSHKDTITWGITLSRRVQAAIGQPVVACRCISYRYGVKTGWGPYTKAQRPDYYWHSSITKVDHPWVPYQLSCQWDWRNRYRRTEIDALQIWLTYWIVD